MGRNTHPPLHEQKPSHGTPDQRRKRGNSRKPAVMACGVVLFRPLWSRPMCWVGGAPSVRCFEDRYVKQTTNFNGTRDLTNSTTARSLLLLLHQDLFDLHRLPESLQGDGMGSRPAVCTQKVSLCATVRNNPWRRPVKVPRPSNPLPGQRWMVMQPATPAACTVPGPRRGGNGTSSARGLPPSRIPPELGGDPDAL